MTEAALIIEAQAGSNEAMSELLRLYDRFCWRCGIRRAPWPGLIDDFVQLARIHFMHTVRTFDPSFGITLISWATRCVPRLLYRDRLDHTGCCRVPNVAYAKGWRSPGCVPLTDSHADAVSFRENHLDRLAAEEQASKLRKAIERLAGARTRQILTLRLSGLTQVEVAGRIGVSKQCVQQTEKLAIGQLKRLLGNQD